RRIGSAVRRSSARVAPDGRGAHVLRHLAGGGRRRVLAVLQEAGMKTKTMRPYALAVAAAFAGSLAVAQAQDTKVDLSKETVGKAPAVFEPMMGMWIVAQDGPDKVIKVDGAAYKSALSTPARLALENARKMYGTTNEELMDNAKQFTTYP